MNHTLAVRIIQGVAKLSDQRLEKVLGQDAAFTSDAKLTQIRPFDVFHRDERSLAFRLKKIMDANDVLVGELATPPRFPAQFVQRRGVARNFRWQKLQRDLLVEPQILSQLDNAHAASAENLNQPETSRSHFDVRLQTILV
jgi:hypothetical protein